MEHVAMPLRPGDSFPDLHWPRVGGGEVRPLAAPGWRMFIVYRGRHCPLCKRYLATLDPPLLAAFAGAGVSVAAVSADNEARAGEDVQEEGWSFPVGFGLTVEQMRRLGLYVSDPRTPQQADGPFAEPGLFLVNPDGKLHVAAVSNAPFARPDLTKVLSGLKITQERNYAPLGMHGRAA